MGEEWVFLSEPLLPCSKVSPMFYDEIFQTRSVGGSFRASIQALPATTKPSQICWLYCIFLPPFIHPSIHSISSLLHSVLQTASHLSWNTLVWIPTVLPCIVFTASNRGRVSVVTVSDTKVTVAFTMVTFCSRTGFLLWDDVTDLEY